MRPWRRARLAGLALACALGLVWAWPLGGPGPALAAPAKGKERPAKQEAKPADKPAESLPDKPADKAPDKSGNILMGDKAGEESVTGFDPKAPAEGDAGLGAPAAPPTYDPRLIQLIEQKRADLALEEARLARERQELQKLQAEVMARIEDLKKVQVVLEELVKTEQDQREGRVQQLVKVLSNMKADAAGAVVAKLDDQMAVEVFSKMAPRTSGKVMSALKPEHAARISELLTRHQASREAAKMAGAAAAAGTQPPAPAQPVGGAKPAPAAPAAPPAQQAPAQPQAPPQAGDQTYKAGAKPGAVPASTGPTPTVPPVPLAPVAAPGMPVAPTAQPAQPAQPTTPAAAPPATAPAKR